MCFVGAGLEKRGKQMGNLYVDLLFLSGKEQVVWLSSLCFSFLQPWHKGQMGGEEEWEQPAWEAGIAAASTQGADRVGPCFHFRHWSVLGFVCCFPFHSNYLTLFQS